MNPLCLGAYFLNINFYMSCRMDPSAAGSISCRTNSTLFGQKVIKGQMIVKNHLSQGNRGRSQVPLRLQIGANPLHHVTYLLMVPVFQIGLSDHSLAHRCIVLLL